jgi:hypothetical protein
MGFAIMMMSVACVAMLIPEAVGLELASKSPEDACSHLIVTCMRDPTCNSFLAELPEEAVSPTDAQNAVLAQCDQNPQCAAVLQCAHGGAGVQTRRLQDDTGCTMDFSPLSDTILALYDPCVPPSAREQQIGGSGGLEPPGPLLEPLGLFLRTFIPFI